MLKKGLSLLALPTPQFDDRNKPKQQKRDTQHTNICDLYRRDQHHLSDQNPIWRKAVLGFGPCAIRHEHPGFLCRIAAAMLLPPLQQRLIKVSRDCLQICCA